MAIDPREQRVKALLAAAWPSPAGGWQDRALAAMAGVRPRRHPNLLTYIIAAALLLLLAAGVFAAARHFFIQGRLHFSDAEIIRIGDSQLKRQALRSHWLSGDLEWATGAMPGGVHMDLSPVSDEIVYVEKDGWPPTRYEIWRANRDGSEAVHLTARADVGGINCNPQWSPDGSMVAFTHSDPAEGQLPCEAGFGAWVMDADGSDARPVMPDWDGTSTFGDWSPDGSRVLCYRGDEDPAVTTDLWGRDVRVVPNVGAEASWSPDGTMIASRIPERDEVEGEPGIWLRLVVTRADGSDPEVLAEQFVSDAAAEAHGARHRDAFAEIDPDHDWRADVQSHAGPGAPVWSPDGRRIAFLAAMPFDPDGVYHRAQTEVWICDLVTGDLKRITHDNVAQHSLIWRQHDGSG